MHLKTVLMLMTKQPPSNKRQGCRTAVDVEALVINAKSCFKPVIVLVLSLGCHLNKFTLIKYVKSEVRFNFGSVAATSATSQWSKCEIILQMKITL